MKITKSISKAPKQYSAISKEMFFIATTAKGKMEKSCVIPDAANTENTICVADLYPCSNTMQKRVLYTSTGKLYPIDNMIKGIMSSLRKISGLKVKIQRNPGVKRVRINDVKAIAFSVGYFEGSTERFIRERYYKT